MYKDTLMAEFLWRKSIWPICGVQQSNKYEYILLMENVLIMENIEGKRVVGWVCL